MTERRERNLLIPLLSPRRDVLPAGGCIYLLTNVGFDLVALVYIMHHASCARRTEQTVADLGCHVSALIPCDHSKSGLADGAAAIATGRARGRVVIR
jgi:hypothetical protein